MTSGQDYTDRLVRLETTWWKRLLSVQAPYRWNLRRLRPGRTLDIGCGIGRNLAHLDGSGVGVDHNAASVAQARARGLVAFTVEGFEARRFAAGSFDSLLLAHLLEHLTPAEAEDLLEHYLPYLRPGGQVIVICPQERGYASDATHVQFLDADAIAALLRGHGLDVTRSSSFPFPRAAGRWFTYNEFVVVATQPAP